MPETLLRFYQLNTRFKRVLEMPANQVYNLNTSLHLHRGSHTLWMCAVFAVALTGYSTLFTTL